MFCLAEKQNNRSRPNMPANTQKHNVTASMTTNFKGKGKLTPQKTTKAHSGSRGIATPWPLYSRGRAGTHCIGDWVGPRASLDWYRKSCPHWNSIPGPSSYTNCAIPAHDYKQLLIKCCNVNNTPPMVSLL